MQSFTVPDNEKIIIAKAEDKEATSTDIEIIYKLPKEVIKIAGDYRKNLIRYIYAYLLSMRLRELEYPDYINNLKSEDFNSLANQYLSKDNVATFVLMPVIIVNRQSSIVNNISLSLASHVSRIASHGLFTPTKPAELL